MSNSVRSLGSSRSVDASGRVGAAHQSDPAAADAGFAAVMNLVIGGSEGVTTANGENANPDNAQTGSGERQYGQVSVTIDQTAKEATDVEASAISIGQTTVSIRGAQSTSKVDKPVTLPIGAGRFSLRSPPAPAATPTVAPAADSPPSADLTTSQHTAVHPTPESSGSSADPDAGTAHQLSSIDVTTLTQTDVEQSTVSPSVANVTNSIGAATPERATPGRQHQHGLRGARTSSPSVSGSNTDDTRSRTQDIAASWPIFEGMPDTAVSADDTTLSPAGPSLSSTFRQVTASADLLSPSQSTNALGQLGWHTRGSGGSLNTAQLNVPTNTPSPASQSALSVATPDQRQPLLVPLKVGATSDATDKNTVPASTGAQSVSDGIANLPSAQPPSPTTDRGDTGSTMPMSVHNVSGPTSVVPALVMSAGTNDSGSAHQPTVMAIDGSVGAASPAPANVVPSGSATGVDSSGTTSNPPAFSNALANHVMSMISNGRQEATLQLQPPQLGEMTVRVAVQGRDVSTWFGAAQPQVQVAVSQALDQLRTDLAGAGLNLAGAWVGADASTMRQGSSETTATVPRPGSVRSIDTSSTDNSRETATRKTGVSVYV